MKRKAVAAPDDAKKNEIYAKVKGDCFSDSSEGTYRTQELGKNRQGSDVSFLSRI
jgi:hypothetical protein